MEGYIRSGFQAVVPKPFSHTQIRVALRYLCNDRAAGGSGAASDQRRKERMPPLRPSQE
jgi:hypothetical protein